jgi:hypothetical protein
MKRMYLDESGNHDLLRIDQQYPIFVLGGVIVDAEYADAEMAARFSELKQQKCVRVPEAQGQA